MENTEQKQDSLPQISSSRICGFWKRAGAFIIDYIILQIVLGLLSTVARATIGINHITRIILEVGLPLLYFSVLQSRQGDGQTFGMCALKIRVVNAAGKTISFNRAAARTAILCFPICLSLLLMLPQLLLSGLGFALNVISYLSILGIAYMAIFNRGTRQSLHDLAAGTFVVHAPTKGPVANCSISKVHYYVVTAVCLLSLPLAIILTSRTMPIAALYASVQKIPNASVVGARDSVIVGPNGRARVVQVTMDLTNSADPEETAKAVAKAVVKQPDIADCNLLSIRLQQDAVDLWLGGSTHVFGATAPPDAWLSSGPVTLTGAREYRILVFRFGYLDKE